MITSLDKDKILNRFCDMYEGREGELGNKPLVYGDLLLIANEMALPVEDIASIIANELQNVVKELNE